MKLLHPEYSFQVEFEEGTVQRLIIESPKMMSSFIADIKRQLGGEDGKWILSDHGQVLKFADVCELIMDIFDVDINQRKVLNILYDELKNEIMNTELLMEWHTVNSVLEGILNKAIDHLGYSISYEEIDLKSLLKVQEVRFREEKEGYLDYLLEYLQLMADIEHRKLFVIINATSFLSKEEIKYIYEQSFYQKYHLLLVDTQDKSVDSSVERKIIIDKDDCIIDLSME